MRIRQKVHFDRFVKSGFVKKGHFVKIIPINTHLFVNDRRNENVPLFNGTIIKTNNNSHNTIKGQ